MSKLVRLGLDLDGVLFDFNTGFIELAERTFGLILPRPSTTWPTEWDYLLDGNYITKAQNRQLWNMICAGRVTDFWLNLPTYPHSLALLLSAATNADECYIITSRCGPKRLDQSTFAVVDLLREAFPFHDIFPPVLVVNDHLHKLPIIQGLELTHYVDDRWETMTALVAKNSYVKAGLWDQPWNRSKVMPKGLDRLHSVEEFTEWLT